MGMPLRSVVRRLLNSSKFMTASNWVDIRANNINQCINGRLQERPPSTWQRPCGPLGCRSQLPAVAARPGQLYVTIRVRTTAGHMAEKLRMRYVTNTSIVAPTVMQQSLSGRQELMAANSEVNQHARA